jgi:hypothetical protein
MRHQVGRPDVQLGGITGATCLGRGAAGFRNRKGLRAPFEIHREVCTVINSPYGRAGRLGAGTVNSRVSTLKSKSMRRGSIMEPPARHAGVREAESEVAAAWAIRHRSSNSYPFEP